MILWIGGIIDSIIADDFRHLRNSVEEKVNTKIAAIDYGPGMSTWDVILVVSSTPPNEYVRYDKVDRETDVRLVINFENFLTAQNFERTKMIEQSLLNSIDKLSKKNIPNFNFVQLQNDVSSALN